VLERDEKQRLMFMGDAPVLDPVLAYVMNLYWRLRRATPGEEPVPISWEMQEREDPCLLHLLAVADTEFLSQQAKHHEARMARMKTANAPKGRRLH
jgi:hypothetical protein